MVDREKIWAALPGEVDQWWRTRSQLNWCKRVVNGKSRGTGKEEARIAYAVRDGDRLNYEVARAPAHEGSRHLDSMHTTNKSVMTCP